MSNLLKHELLALSAIRTDGGTQTRAAIDEATAQEYAEALLAAEELPSADVFFDGATYYLAAGFHRKRAHEIAGKAAMWCRIHPGTQRDAILFGIQDNVRHGLRPSADDRRRAVAILLSDPEWRQWSNSHIARLVAGCESGAAQQLVADTRERLSSLAGKMGADDADNGKRKATRGGTDYEMDTGAIGKPKAKPKREPAHADDQPWLRAALEDIERAREALTRCEGQGQAVLALDLARGLVCQAVADGEE